MVSRGVSRGIDVRIIRNIFWCDFFGINLPWSGRKTFEMGLFWLRSWSVSGYNKIFRSGAIKIPATTLCTCMHTWLSRLRKYTRAWPTNHRTQYWHLGPGRVKWGSWVAWFEKIIVRLYTATYCVLGVQTIDVRDPLTRLNNRLLNYEIQWRHGDTSLFEILRYN